MVKLHEKLEKKLQTEQNIVDDALRKKDIRVCDYEKKTQFSSQNSACGKALTWDNTIVKTAEAQYEFHKAQEALDCSLRMLMTGEEGERITEAIISPKASQGSQLHTNRRFFMCSIH
jgi:hypothetical protein